MRIIPFCVSSVLISFLMYQHRVAALTMNKELAISSKQFGLVAEFSFLGISCLKFEQLMLHKIGARSG